MSFLSLLYLASAFYFALGRPDDVIATAAAAAGVPAPEQSDMPSVDDEVYQKQIEDFKQDMSQAMDTYIMPMMPQQDVLIGQDRYGADGFGITDFFNNYGITFEYVPLTASSEEEDPIVTETETSTDSDQPYAEA